MSHERPRPVIVLGMHRSGTSLLTRIVNLLGVRTDDEELMLPPSWENPRGYWEPEYLADLNDAIIELVGSVWYAPRALALRELKPAGSFVARMLDRIEERYAEPTSFLWKDPRLSLTWPVWAPVLPNPVMLICMRNPASVAASLADRNGFPRDLTYALWEIYVRSAFEYASPETHGIVHYEDLIADPLGQIDPLLRWLRAMGVQFASEPLIEEARDEAIPRYDRNHREIDELEKDPLAEHEQKELYARLRESSLAEGFLHTWDKPRVRELEAKVLPARGLLEQRWRDKRVERLQAETLEELKALSQRVSALERTVEKLAPAPAVSPRRSLATAAAPAPPPTSSPTPAAPASSLAPASSPAAAPASSPAAAPASSPLAAPASSPVASSRAPASDPTAASSPTAVPTPIALSRSAARGRKKK